MGSRKRAGAFLLVCTVACTRGGKYETADAARRPDVTSGTEARPDPPLSLSTRTLDLKMRFGESASGEARLTGRLASSAHLSVRSVEPPGPIVTILPKDASGAEGVGVAFDGKRVGRASGQVELETALADPSTLTLLYSWQVTGSLTIDPTNPFIDSRGAGARAVDVEVSSTRADFRLAEARVIDGSFLATFHRDVATGSYVVHVAVKTPVPGDARGMVGTLRLVSNDPAEPTLDVPVFALGDFGAHP
jgi:hypothetical protein